MVVLLSRLPRISLDVPKHTLGWQSERGLNHDVSKKTTTAEETDQLRPEMWLLFRRHMNAAQAWGGHWDVGYLLLKSGKLNQCIEIFVSVNVDMMTGRLCWTCTCHNEVSQRHWHCVLQKWSELKRSERFDTFTWIDRKTQNWSTRHWSISSLSLTLIFISSAPLVSRLSFTSVTSQSGVF